MPSELGSWEDEGGSTLVEEEQAIQRESIVEPGGDQRISQDTFEAIVHGEEKSLS